jgi:hypothetical protein
MHLMCVRTLSKPIATRLQPQKLRESVTALDTTYLSGGDRTMSHQSNAVMSHFLQLELVIQVAFHRILEGVLPRRMMDRCHRASDN